MRSSFLIGARAHIEIYLYSRQCQQYTRLHERERDRDRERESEREREREIRPANIEKNNRSSCEDKLF